MPAFILRHAKTVLLIITLLSAGMFYQAIQVEKSYNYVSALPENSAAAADYALYKKYFPYQNNTIIIGIQTTRFFEADFFSAYRQLTQTLRNIPGVAELISLDKALFLDKDLPQERFITRPVFPPAPNQQQLDKAKQLLATLPLYQHLLYNPRNNAYLIALNISEPYALTKKRDTLVVQIDQALQQFQQSTNNTTLFASGIPYIRNKISGLIAQEMQYLMIGAALFLILIMRFLFRAWGYVFITALILGLGIIWSFGTMALLGFQLTLLNAIVPSLIIIIGVPNCIYFFNKYRSACRIARNQAQAAELMLLHSGKITLFCNLTTALGFFVFIFTSSELLFQFSIVASVNIIILFILSYLLIPILLTHTSPPKTPPRAAKRSAPLILKILPFIYKKKRLIICISLALCVFSFIGIQKIESNSFVIDDLPAHSPMRQNLRFFETHFKGIMPLEILIHTHKKRGIHNPQLLQQADSFCRALAQYPELSATVSLIEGLKFLRQMYYNGDSAFYALPAMDWQFIAPYMQNKNQKNPELRQILHTFTDSAQQILRISLRIADIGQKATEQCLTQIRQQLHRYIDSTHYTGIITGNTLAFLEGNRAIMTALKESSLWAVGFIALIMLYLFRSLKITLISLAPNLLAILLSLSWLGWFHITLKPSLVIIFSITLGIAVDISIRLLVLFHRFLRQTRDPVQSILRTFREAVLSVIYTSLTLMGGFSIFLISHFESIFYLGLITTLTLLSAALANILLLPLLLTLNNPPKKPQLS